MHGSTTIFSSVFCLETDKESTTELELCEFMFEPECVGAFEVIVIVNRYTYLSWFYFNLIWQCYTMYACAYFKQ